MKKIKLLDCTLRDGGSLNNWMFGKTSITNIVQSLNNAHIEIIELGFIENTREYNENSSNNPSDIFFNNISKKIKNKKCETYAMIDFSKYNKEDFNLASSDGLDGIRIMFKKEQLNDVIDFCKKLKQLKYKISLNPVSITRYSQEELINLIEQANILIPEIIYIVDTYGLLNTNETIKYFKLFNSKLSKNIQLGYHVHNNLQLALANSIALANIDTERGFIIDASLYGMGKRAGNTPIEAISLYLNNCKNKNYDTELIVKTIDEEIIPLKKKYEWGYSLTHYIAAINKCHSDYVSYLRKEKNIPINTISEILNTIPNEKKLTFEKNCIINCLNSYNSAKI